MGREKDPTLRLRGGDGSRAGDLTYVVHEVDSKPAHAKSAYAAPKIVVRFIVCATRLIALRNRNPQDSV